MLKNYINHSSSLNEIVWVNKPLLQLRGLDSYSVKPCLGSLLASLHSRTTYHIMRIALLLLSVVLSSVVQGQPSSHFFVKREFNQTDEIIGVGASIVVGSMDLVKTEIVSSLNYAQVLDDSSYMRDYLALDTGVRMGIYAQTFIYIEAGFDAFEFIWDDARNDEYEFHHSVLEQNTIDVYVALGTGIRLKNMRLEGLVKVRQIDSVTWKSNQHLFYGVQLSMLF